MDLRFTLPFLVAAATCACAAAPWGIEDEVEVDWFKEGPYAGIKLGQAQLDVAASELDAELAARGYTSTSMLDDSDTAASLYAGYRFHGPYSLEVGYVNLGQVESSISASPANINQFLTDVADVHPFIGRGVSLTGSYIFLDRDRFELSLKGGAWYWDAEVEVQAASGETAEIDEEGIDLTLGVQALFGLSDHLDLMVGWDRFYLDDNEADAFWVGLQGSLF